MSNIKHPLKFEPYNEQEVIFLFALIYQELGFKIIHIRTTFPDCIAIDKFNNQKGFLKIKKKPPVNKLYAVQKNKNLIQLAESFLQLLND